MLQEQKAVAVGKAVQALLTGKGQEQELVITTALSIVGKKECNCKLERRPMCPLCELFIWIDEFPIYGADWTEA